MLKKDKLKQIDNKDSTLNEDEILFFEEIAEEWRKPNGKLKNIYQFNAARCNYFLSDICDVLSLDINTTFPLKGLSILDIGCGAGLIAEHLCLQGGHVTGIDASEKNIKIASAHAKINNLSINYINCLTSEIIESKQEFDIVINTEVVEHVSDQQKLIEQCCECTRNNGIIIIATINKTITSFFKAILGAEYILRLLPRGTHNWNYFVKPREIINIFNDNHVKTLKIKGMSYNLLSNQWCMTEKLDVNYYIVAKKYVF